MIEGVYLTLQSARNGIPKHLRAFEKEHNSHGLWWGYYDNVSHNIDYEYFITEEKFSI